MIASKFVSYELVVYTIIMISRATTTTIITNCCLCSLLSRFDTLLSHEETPKFLRIVRRVRKEVSHQSTTTKLRQQSTMQPKLQSSIHFYAFTSQTSHEYTQCIYKKKNLDSAGKPHCFRSVKNVQKVNLQEFSDTLNI